MEKDRPDPKTYERVAAAFVTENVGAGIDVNCKINVFLEGSISRVRRQVDLLIETGWVTGRRSRIFVDAKRYDRPLDVKDVESFEGMMRDCNADRGILVCPNGWTGAAKRRAQDAITITLLSEEDVKTTSYWASFEECSGPCVDKVAPEKRGKVLCDQEHVLQVDSAFVLLWTGKCDRCHHFQVWCWDCGGKYSLGDADSVTCDCGRRWFTTIVSEGNNPALDQPDAVYLNADFTEGTMILDRRSLR